MSQVITLIEDITPSRLLPSLSPSRSDILKELQFCVVTTSPAKLPRSTVSTTNVYANMEMQTYGSFSQICSTTFPLPPSSITKSSASTEVSPQVLIPSTTSELSTEFKKFLTKVLCAISYGPTQMTDVDGAYLLEELDILSVRTFQRRSTTTTV